jgi:hypothetical protein
MPYKKEIAICKQKVRFSSQAAAQAALQRINPSKKSGKPIRTYKCPVCSGWHLTSQRSRQAANPFKGILFYIVILALLLLLYLLMPE